jgi:hypothetical protein
VSQRRAKTAECEHSEGDQRLGGMEASGLPYLWDSAGAEIPWDWIELAGAPWERC